MLQSLSPSNALGRKPAITPLVRWGLIDVKCLKDSRDSLALVAFRHDGGSGVASHVCFFMADFS